MIEKNHTMDDVLASLEELSAEAVDLTGQLRRVEKFGQHLKIVGELVKDAFVVMNSRGQIEYANNAALDMYGYNLEELKGQNLSIFRFMDENEKLITLDKLFEIGHEDTKGIYEEVLAQKKDGERFYCEYSFNTFSRSSSYGFVLILRDVSKKTNERNELKKEVEKHEVKSKVLTVISELSQMFLDPFIDIDKKINCAVKVLGETINAQRVGCYLNSADEDGQILTELKYEWVSSNTKISPMINKFSSNAINWKLTLPNYFQKLSEGHHLCTYVEDLDEPEKDLAISHVETIVLFPVFRGNMWAGTIVFNHDKKEKWDDLKVDVCKIASSVLSAALENERLSKKMYQHRQEIKYRKNRYDAVVDSMKDGIILTNSSNNGMIVFANQCVADILGYKVEEMLGRSIIEFVNFSDQEKIQHEFFERRKNDNHQVIDKICFMTKDKKKAIFERNTSKNIVRDDKSFDVVHRLNLLTEKESNEETSWASIYFKKSLTAKVLVDKNFNIKTINDVFCRDYSFSRNKLLEKKFTTIFPEKVWKEYIHKLKKLDEKPSEAIIIDGNGISTKVIISYEAIRDDTKKLIAILFYFRKEF